uniref:Tubulin gamma chain-like n=1 Tax=Dermatophagoides pteronyssinus TaxID=6956 RepID=A0A6P6Y8T1_DERPT
MTREVITLSVGQCGNQLAHDFWLRLAEMLGINMAGCAPELTTEGSQFGRNVRYDVCFNEVEEGRFVARSVLLDLEPRIVNSILHGPQGALHSTKNAWVGSDGGGAGNLWTNGYAQGRLYADVIQEKVRAELEKADCAEAVNLLHSINGGTGSGLGSALLEFLRDAFPKKILQTYSVLPDCDASSSVVVQPYNAMLTFDRLTHCADAVHPIQNARLDAICTDTYQLAQPSVSTQNSIIADAVTALLAPLLFPSFANSSLASVLSSLVPLPKLH